MREERFRFGIFDFDPCTLELRRDGSLVRFQAQPAQVLGRLIGRAGDVVSREDLRTAVWPEGTFVDFERGLNFCIAQIRAALNDDATEPRFVRTIPKRGYQFIAPVERIGKTGIGQSELPRPKVINPGTERLTRTTTTKRVVAASLLLASLLAVSYWARNRFLARKTPIVAVVRFDNETGDPAMTRFSDALSDMLVVDLVAKAGGQYRVIGNATELRVAREQRDLKSLASSLGASYAILGQVQRKGGQTRILAHLIHLPDQTHVWVTLVDNTIGDPLALESQVAQTVAVEFAPKIRTTFEPFVSHRRASL
jgi:DNA-binding winged helix-turn-helix (wHTH) protein/TolB-like protein